MHVIFRESRGLEETEVATDLGQSPAPLIVLSFSDSDLGAFAAGWHAGRNHLPELRLANLAALKHPLSVDTYIERTVSGARAVLVRLIGGAGYWPYGLAQLSGLARREGLLLPCCPLTGAPTPRWRRPPPCPQQCCASLPICATQAAPWRLRQRWQNWRVPPGCPHQHRKAPPPFQTAAGISPVLAWSMRPSRARPRWWSSASIAPISPVAIPAPSMR
jgi:hypothetical protein